MAYLTMRRDGREKSAMTDGLYDERFMLTALDLAKEAATAGEVPVGAVIADTNGNVLAAARNECESSHDATAHAEMLAIQRAARKIGNWRLTGCTLFVTLEPCPMCAGAILNTRLSRLVFGVGDPQLGAMGSVFNLPAHSAFASALDVKAGVCEDECRNILKDFFAKQRKI